MSFDPWFLVVLFATTTVLFGWALWSLKLELHTRWSEVGALRRGERWRDMIATLSLSTLTQGNHIRILQNGDQFFPALLEAIRAAKSSVHLETFLWRTGECSKQVSDALIERARAGVTVRLLLDAMGGRPHRDERERLREAGVKLSFYNHARFHNLGTFNTRDHRKLAIIDGLVGFVGGHCIKDEWLGNAEDPQHFRDTTVRVEGPVVIELQGVFSDNWTEAAGELLAEESLFPAPRVPETGGVSAHLAYLSLSRRTSSVKVLHHLAIESAEREILIQNPYFVPFGGARDALCRARERGVRVRVTVPSLRVTDAKLVSHATRHAIRSLLECGCEIYLYERTLLHQKVFVIDREWAGIGSTNFDDRSMDINEEVTLSVFDAGVAEALASAFEADLAHARLLGLEEWRGRGIGAKATDWLAYRVRAQI